MTTINPQAEDFRDILSALQNANVEFLVVGGFAMGAHGCSRMTKDIDLWIACDSANAQRVYQALRDFGAPLSGMTPDDFTEQDVVYQVGVAPIRVDILTSVESLTFPEAYANKVEHMLFGVGVYVLSREDLIANKRSVGRTQDLADVERLEKSAPN